MEGSQTSGTGDDGGRSSLRDPQSMAANPLLPDNGTRNYTEMLSSFMSFSYRRVSASTNDLELRLSRKLGT